MPRAVTALLLSIFLAAVAGCTAANTYVGKSAPKKQEVKTLFTYKLDNGFTVLVDNSYKGGTTALQVWVSDGSSDDPAGKPGLSHFVEHMLFEGSNGLSQGGAVDTIEGMGGELAGHTGKDYSYVGVTLPGAGWERALELLYRMTAAPTFTPEQAEEQRTAVGLEIQTDRTDPVRFLMDGFFEDAYKEHPYRNPLAGYADSVKGFTAGDATAYHSAAYVPSGMTLVVAGDVVPEQVKSAAEDTFGKMPRASERKRKPVREPSQISVRERNVYLPVNLTYMALGWHICSNSDPDIYPLEVLGAVMGQGRGSRLVMELRERKALVIDVDTELYTFKDPGVFVIRAAIKDSEDVRWAKEEILRQVLKLKTELISDEELERAVKGVQSMQMLAKDTAEGQAYSLGYWYTVFGEKNPVNYVEGVQSVTAEEVRRVAQTYLGEGNYTLTVVGSSRDGQ